MQVDNQFIEMQLSKNMFVFFRIYFLPALALSQDRISSHVHLLEHYNFSNIPNSDYQPQQEKFINWKKMSSTLHLTTQWEAYVSSFSSENCLTFLDNFAQMDLVGNRLPGVIRWPQIAMTNNRMFWTLLRIWGKNSTNTVAECASQYFVMNSIDFLTKDTCLRLNMKTFITHSKPWRCLVKLELFPPLELYHEMRGPPASIHNNFKDNSFMKCTMPSLFAIVKPYQLQLLPDKLVSYWVSPTIESLVMQNKLFVIVSVIKEGIRFDPVGNLYSITVIKYCPGCFGTAAEFWETSWQVLLLNGSIKENMFALTAGYPSPSDLLEVAIRRPANNIVFDHFMMWIAECEKGTPNLLNSAGADNLFANLGKAFATIWKYIFRNYSVVTSELDSHTLASCKNGNEVKIRNRQSLQTTLREVYYPIGYFYPLAAFQDPSSTLRFVSCGSRTGSKALPFSELLAPFDLATWLALLSSLVSMSVAILPNPRTHHKELVNKFISLLKVLLEQGDPFPRHIVLRRIIRVMSSCFLLIGIVLSNAYKNTNVYRMILPRSLVPFEYFRELVESNFTVYNTVTSIKKYKQMPGVRSCTGLELSPRNDYNYCVSTAVDTVSGMGRKIWKYFEMLENNIYSVEFQRKIMRHVNNLPINKLGLVNRSILHHHVLQNLQDSQDPSILHIRDQEVYLYNALQSCNNIALVTPEHMCKYYARKLKKEKSYAEVYIGKEVYSEFSWFFSLTGNIPPHVIKNTQSIRDSGLWEWAIGMSTSKFSFSDKDQVVPPKSASLQGNIVIIFIVWFVGVLLGSLWFLVEIMPGIIAVFVKSLVIFVFSLPVS